MDLIIFHFKVKNDVLYTTIIGTQKKRITSGPQKVFLYRVILQTNKIIKLNA